MGNSDNGINILTPKCTFHKYEQNGKYIFVRQIRNTKRDVFSKIIGTLLPKVNNWIFNLIGLEIFIIFLLGVSNDAEDSK